MDDALDELAPDSRVQRRDQPQPQAGQIRGEHRHREHSDPHAALSRVLTHDVGVGHAVGPANLVHAVAGDR